MNTQTFTSRLSSRKDTLSYIFRKAQKRVSSTTTTTTAWLNPERSIGRYIGKAGRECVWDAVGPAREVFSKIAPSIKAHLENAVEPISSRVIWSMYMVGRAPSSAAPTIIFCCEVLDHRREVRNTIKESGILNGYPGVKTGHLPRPPSFNQLVPIAEGDVLNENCHNLFMLGYRYKSACGFKLLLASDGEDPETCSAVATVGGVIRIGDDYYYTTAAHALQSDFWLLEGQRSPTWPVEDYVGDDDAFSWDGSDTDTATTYSHEEATVPPFKSENYHGNMSGNNSQQVEERMGSGQGGFGGQRGLSGEELGESSSSYVPPELAELSLSPIGMPVTMTSKDLEHQDAGLDYALIRVSSPDHLLSNVVNFGVDDQEVRTIGIECVARSEPQDVDIIAATSRGVIKGYISGTPSFSSAPGHRFHHKMFKVSLDGPLQRGDCGTWIVDAKCGDLYGHIIAGSPGDGVALIVLFADIFEDINSESDQAPCLPTAQEDIIMARNDSRPVETAGVVENVTEVPQPEVLSNRFVADHTALEPPPHEDSTEAKFKDLVKVFERLMEEKRLLQLKRGRSDPQRLEEAEKDGPSGTINSKGENIPTSLDHVPPPPSYESLENMDYKGKGISTSPDCVPSPPSHNPVRSLPLVPTAPSPGDLEAQSFQELLFSLSQIPVRWENPELLDKALEEINLDMIYNEAEEKSNVLMVAAYSMDDGRRAEWGYQDCVIQALLRYFKSNFSVWDSNPSCQVCFTLSPTIREGTSAPTSGEIAGGASTVELYRCSETDCSAQIRFPRYLNPWTVMQTRRGRCEELANCFGMLCRAIGSRVRWVWSAEEYVWTEVYSEHQKRWVHVDACEGVWDKPLLYTEERGKKMSYCIAFSVDGATDVTRRYVQSSNFALPRAQCPEEVLPYIVKEIRAWRRTYIPEKDKSRLENEDAEEARELLSYIVESLTLEVARLPKGLLEKWAAPRLMSRLRWLSNKVDHRRQRASKE